MPATRVQPVTNDGPGNHAPSGESVQVQLEGTATNQPKTPPPNCNARIIRTNRFAPRHHGAASFADEQWSPATGQRRN